MKNLRILILDDDWIRHDIWGRMFRKAGHEVQCVFSIKEFEKQLRHRWDIIFLDHDLNDWVQESYDKAGKPFTGQNAAMMVERLPKSRRPQKVVIHSWNDRGALAMYFILRDFCPVTIKPFSTKLYFEHPTVRRRDLARFCGIPFDSKEELEFSDEFDFKYSELFTGKAD